MRQVCIDVRSRTVLRVLGVVLGVAIVLEVVWISRHVISWLFISLFLALALDPLVSWLERRGRLRRSAAIGVAYLMVALAVVAIGLTFVPKLVEETNGFVQALPGYVHDLTHGRGRLGFLEGKYHVVEKVRTVGGYVTGNLLISLIAGVSITIVLLVLGVPYAVALGLLVAVLDLIPLAGATIAGIIVIGIAFLHSVPAGIVVGVFFIVYQQLENHFLQPLVYGRTVKLSPLVVLVSVLVGAELAGILGALGAIPVAGSIQVILRDLLAHRRRLVVETVGPPAPDA